MLVATLHDAHAGALLGVGVGAVFHTVAHVIDRGLGGSPATDIPIVAIVAVVLLWAGTAKLRATG